MNQTPLRAGAGQLVRQRLGPWVPVLGLAALALAFEIGGDAARLAFRFEREALEAGEWWRLVTGHLVHLGWSHLGMNLAALLLIRLLIDDAFTAGDWIGAALVGAFGVDAGLYLLAEEVDWYVGLSGVLHGLVAAGSLALLRGSPVLGAVLGGGLVVKLLLERATGPLPLTEAASGGAVIVASHLYGAAGGALYGTARSISRRKAASI